MENNSLTPSPVPTPNPGTNMPEFAAAPVQPEQPLPPASAMPDFGNQQPVTQPAPMPSVQGMPMPQAQPMPMPEPQMTQQTQPMPEPIAATQTVEDPATMQAPTVAQTPEDPTASQLGEIMDSGNPADAVTQPSSEQPVTQNSAETQPTNSPISELLAKQQASAPAPQANPTPDKKKPNTKLIILIAVAALLVIGCVVAAIILMNQPKSQSNPSTAPVQTVDAGPDTSTDFDELTNELAADFLTAVEGDTTYFPDDYTDEETLELIADKNIAMFYSYEKTSDILNIVKESEFAAKFKDKITKDNVTITEKDNFAVVELDADATSCGSNCTGIIFDKKAVNFYAEPYTDVLTGVQSMIVHIMIIDHTKTNVEKVAPLIASVFMNKQKIYSTELKETNGEFEYIVNTLEYKDSKKEKIVAKKTHFKVVATGEFLYMPDLTTETVL